MKEKLILEISNAMAEILSVEQMLLLNSKIQLSKSEDPIGFIQ